MYPAEFPGFRRGTLSPASRNSGRRHFSNHHIVAMPDKWEYPYVTNAVKHFKFAPRGKRRLHKRPNAREIEICRRWLFEEIEAISPRLIVALGATAARGLTGRMIPVQSNPGSLLTVDKGLRVLMTIHPSALLRLQDEEEKRSGYASFVNELRSIERLVDYSPR
jgi:uracil-DNA glycosylase